MNTKILRSTSFWIFNIAMIIVGVCIAIKWFKSGNPIDADPQPNAPWWVILVMFGILLMFYLVGTRNRY